MRVLVLVLVLVMLVLKLLSLVVPGDCVWCWAQALLQVFTQLLLLRLNKREDVQVEEEVVMTVATVSQVRVCWWCPTVSSGWATRANTLTVGGHFATTAFLQSQ